MKDFKDKVAVVTGATNGIELLPTAPSICHSTEAHDEIRSS
jgi:hypothetical protein